MKNNKFRYLVIFAVIVIIGICGTIEVAKYLGYDCDLPSLNLLDNDSKKKSDDKKESKKEIKEESVNDDLYLMRARDIYIDDDEEEDYDSNYYGEPDPNIEDTSITDRDRKSVV